MSAQSASLRDLYSSSSPSWSFVPQPAGTNGSTSTSAASALEPAYQWSSRPRTNSIYELSPDLDLSASSPNVVALLRAAAASAILQYLSAAVESPWEVGKTLLQVQYVPKSVKPEELGQVEDEEVSSRCIGYTVIRFAGLIVLFIGSVCLCASLDCLE